MNKLLALIGRFNSMDNYLNILLPFELRGKIIGYVFPDFYQILIGYEDIFSANNDRKLRFTEELEMSKMELLTEKLNEVNKDLHAKGIIRGWRNEFLPVVCSYSSEPLLLIERGAYQYYGTKAYGVHVNGFVRNKENNEITHLWVGKRSSSKSTWPRMLDHIVAGGQPYGISLINNVVKECNEEAGIPESLAMQATPVGAVSYNCIDITNKSLQRDALFCFDLELPADFVPIPIDGEVESFQLCDIDWVINKVIEGGENGYKPNCNLVLLDFFIRYKIIYNNSN